jgi:hypothetical protein
MDMIAVIITIIILIISKLFQRKSGVIIGGNDNFPKNIPSRDVIACRINIPKSHIKWLDENIPKSIRPQFQHGFNMSLIPFGSKFICSIRFYNTIHGLITNEIIPGNKENKKYPVKHIGRNFIWGYWKNKGMMDSTVMFECDFNGTNITPISKPITMENHDTFHKNTKGVPFSISDIRLFTHDNVLYMYDGFITIIKEIDISKQIMERVGYFNNKVCDAVGGYNKEYDKNWSLLSVDDISFTFIHWFESDGIYSICVPKNYTRPCKKEIFIRFKKDHIPPLGSKILPMFSFGVPFIDTPYGKLACGHCKIMTTYNYEINSNIHTFRKLINNEFSGNINYVQHASYMYLGYFILYKDNDIFISDAFLPIPDDSPQYLFSIFFPMSMFLLNDVLYLVGGYGDYYNIILQFQVADVNKFCRHAVSEFEATKYDYLIIKNKEAIIA